MTVQELRSFCMALPGTHEKETFGDATHPGHPTFRVRDRIYVIAGEHGDGISVRTSREQQVDLVDAFPDLARPAPYVGRFGWTWLDLRAADEALVRDVVTSAWRRTAPKTVVAGWEEGRA